jgi:two-component system cell cycle sensor histidine kinase/response regulator CckA
MLLMSSPLRVLLVEDSETDAKLILHALRKGGHVVEAERVETAAHMRAALERQRWDIVISDWSMPNFSAHGALALLQQISSETPLIIVSGTIGEEAAVEAMRAGARDYVLKDKLARLVPAVERELREGEHRRSVARTAEERVQRSEEKLRQMQKMEAIGGLAGGIAHDFNNLLTVILSYSSLLAREFKPDDPRRAELLQINEAGERAAALTQQLLAFSRQQVLKPKIVQLNVLIGGTEKMLRRLIGEDIELRVIGARDLWKVQVDPSQIDQVIMNLAVNARDAMPRGGVLTIETENISIDGAHEQAGLPQGEYVRLVVTDTGVGMDDVTQARVFEPFFTTKEMGRGTGLGLSTVLGIVQQSGGSIVVRSAAGAGSAFSIYLPSCKGLPFATATSRPPMQALPRGSETILLVEDDASVRTLACNVLRRHGYQVLEALSGGDALLQSEQHAHPIQLLLTDVVMPKMSGPQLAARIRTSRDNIRVLFMSGYTDDATGQHGLSDRDVDFLPKPFTPEQMVKKVREVLDADLAQA